MPEPSLPTESPLAEGLRSIYRVYRNLPLCLGHGAMRRLFRLLVARHQRIRLRNGLRLELDIDRVPQNTLFWLDGEVEPSLEWIVRDLVPPGGTLVDCGANCGYIGLLARRLRMARVLFVEPHPRLAASIRRNLELNGWDSACPVVEAAASDTYAEITLHESSHADGSHSVLPDWVKEDAGSRRGIRVQGRTLRSILESTPGFAHVDFLKIDTEGHDLAVLRGLGDFLGPDRIAAVYAELGRDRDAAFRHLEAAGYVGFGARTLRRRALNRIRRRQVRGEPVTWFEPWRSDAPPEAETLWVPRGSPCAAYLDTLANGTPHPSAGPPTAPRP